MTTDLSNDSAMPRRRFLKLSAATVGGLGAAPSAELEGASGAEPSAPPGGRASAGGERPFNSNYTESNLNQIAFPLGGIGAGMVCLEGAGALSHVSLRNRPEVYNEPCVFAAISLKGQKKVARVLEDRCRLARSLGLPGQAMEQEALPMDCRGSPGRVSKPASRSE